jgi:hypothetical protein
MAREPGERHESATALVDDIAWALSERELPPTEAMAASDLPAAPASQRTAEVEVEPERSEPERSEPEREPTPPPPPQPEPQRRPQRRPPERERERRPPAILLLGAAALAVAAVAAVLIASGGGGDPKPSSTRASTTARTTASTARGSTSTSTSTTSTKAAAPASASPASPAGAVQAFYGRAVAHRYDDAWALAAPGLRSQLQGFDAFQRQFSTARSIVFSRAQTVQQSDSAATVAITTTTTHTNRTDHCTGTAETAPAPGGGWIVTHLNVNC